MVKRLKAAIVQQVVGRLHEDLAAYRLSRASPHDDAHRVALGGLAGFIAHV